MTDSKSAIDWFTTEHPTLLALQAQALQRKFDTHVWQLAWSMTDFLNRQGRWREQHTTHQAALTAATRLANNDATAYALRGLGVAAVYLGQFDDAHSNFGDALRLFDKVGDRAGQGNTHINLANLAAARGQHIDALHHSEHALDHYRACPNRVGEARALNAIGWCHAQLGDYRRALPWCQQAHAVLLDLEDPDGLAYTLDSLGYIHRHLGHHQQAITCYQKALNPYRGAGDLHEADGLASLGDAYLDNNDVDAARTAWRQAMTIFTEFGHPQADELRDKLHAADDRSRQHGGSGVAKMAPAAALAAAADPESTTDSAAPPDRAYPRITHMHFPVGATGPADGGAGRSGRGMPDRQNCQPRP